MRLPRLLPATALLAVGAVLATASAAAAAPLTAYEMPFPCGQAWTGTTRPSHSPSAWSIDWNRTDDVGDPVVAAAAGVVTTAVPNGTRGYGRYVVVDHGNGESTLYGHLQTVNVGIGQTVDQGSLVGLLGDTGNATGPHLHFEERLNGKTVEPWFHGAAFAFGSTPQSQNCPDVPMAGNFVGDGIAELAVFDRATSTFQISGPAGPISGRRSAWPPTPRSSGDWDGDGMVNVGVRRFVRPHLLPVDAERSRVRRDGQPERHPGRRRLGRQRHVGASASARRRATSSGCAKPDGKSFPVRLGKAGDIPISGDWNGDGITDLGVYDITTARFSLRVKDAERPGVDHPRHLRLARRPARDRRLGRQRPHRPRRVATLDRAVLPAHRAGSPAAPATKSVSRTYGTPRR